MKRSIGSLLSAVEMQTRFPSEWVLVGAPATDKSLAVRGGRVLFHSPNRDAVYRKAVELRPRRYAMLYTGVLPKNTAIVL